MAVIENDDLITVLLKINSREKMRDFLQGILTPAELDEITTRLEIVKLLKQGVPQHEIAQLLGVGVATVTRGSKELKQNHFKYI